MFKKKFGFCGLLSYKKMKISKLSSCSSFFLSCLLICSLATLIDAKFYSASVARRNLVTDLFVNYDAAAKPASRGECIKLHASLKLQHFDFHESDGSFHFVGLLDVSWRDPKLGWNPNDYNNLSRILVERNLIWVPDLEVYNNAPDKFLRMHDKGIVLLEHTGMVLWSDNIEINVFCTNRLYDWPHDRHECKLSLGSWTYDGFEVDFVNHTNLNATLSFDQVNMENMEYKVIEYGVEHISTVYKCCVEPYITMEYHLTFERRCTYAIVFRVLSLTVIMLSLLTLCMVARDSYKLYINGLNFIIITFVLIYFAHNVGQFAHSTPAIVKFFSYTYIMVTLQQILAIFSIFATCATYRGKLHSVISTLLRSTVVSYITPPRRNMKNSLREAAAIDLTMEDVSHQESSNLITTDDTPYEWMQLASFLQSIALLLFVVIYLVLATICFV